MRSASCRLAFSLIELLVALSILAVMAALIIPRFLNVRTQAQATVLTAQLSVVNRAYDNWLSLGGVPGTATGIQIIAFLSTTGGAAADRGLGFACFDATGNFGSNTISITATADTSNTAPTSASADGFYRAAAGNPQATGAGAGGVYYKMGNSLYPISFNSGSSPAFWQTTTAAGGVVGSL